ncbi:hypothetical protein D9M68_902060 [compost metagenome]
MIESYLELVGTFGLRCIVVCQLCLVSATQADEVVAMAPIGLPQVRKLELQQEALNTLNMIRIMR